MRNPYEWLNDRTPAVLPEPVKGRTPYAFQRGGHTYFFASLDDVKCVAEFYRGLAWASRKAPIGSEVTGKTGGPISSAIQRDREAVTNLCDRQRYQGSSAWSREADRKRPQPRILKERIAPEDRTPRKEQEDDT